jgi:AcrR family transcriptional regulator
MVSPADAAEAPAGRKLGRPAATDSFDTRDRIILCACEKFAGEGFDGTTNKEIASLAGVSSAALYHYFPSKADLYVAVCEYITRVFEGVFQRATDFDPRLERRMIVLLAENAKIGDEEPFIVGFATGISRVLTKHPEVAEGAFVFNTNFRRMMLELVETSTEKSEILAGGSESSFADLTVAALAGFGRMSARGEHVRRAAAGEMYLRLIRAAAHK